MKRLPATLAATVLGLGLVGTASRAHAGVEVGGTAGLHTFNKDSALGVPDNPTNPISLRNSSLFALRLGVYFGSLLGVEAEVGLIPTEPRNPLFDVLNLTYRAHLIIQARAADWSHHWIPFALAGAGILQVVDSANETLIEKNSVVTPYAGVGVKYRTGNGWGVRLDLRALLPKKQGSGVTLDTEALLSIYREWPVRKPAVKQEEAPPPPVDEDPDKDGILGSADLCPTEPEDKDGFEDEDGCPDPDNDKDGIADADDKCPLEAEDKDNFEDEDGCPDPDNDQDGVPDAADKCPLEPETKNGFEDDDGCPDEIPEKLKQFTGVIQGINFKSGSDQLLATSSKVLDKAVAVLQEFPQARMEVDGHTDDQAPKKGGKFADNDALSQARAETVKAYFVKKGITEDRLVAKGFGATTPVVDMTGLKGGKLNAARAKNRRVEFKLITGAEGSTAAPAAPDAPPAPTP